VGCSAWHRSRIRFQSPSRAVSVYDTKREAVDSARTAARSGNIRAWFVSYIDNATLDTASTGDYDGDGKADMLWAGQQFERRQCGFGSWMRL
jgi:hypothetical protein